MTFENILVKSYYITNTSKYMQFEYEYQFFIKIIDFRENFHRKNVPIRFQRFFNTFFKLSFFRIFRKSKIVFNRSEKI